MTFEDFAGMVSGVMADVEHLVGRVVVSEVLAEVEVSVRGMAAVKDSWGEVGVFGMVAAVEDPVGEVGVSETVAGVKDPAGEVGVSVTPVTVKDTVGVSDNSVGEVDLSGTVAAQWERKGCLGYLRLWKRVQAQLCNDWLKRQ